MSNRVVGIPRISGKVLINALLGTDAGRRCLAFNFLVARRNSRYAWILAVISALLLGWELRVRNSRVRKARGQVNRREGRGEMRVWGAIEVPLRA